MTERTRRSWIGVERNYKFVDEISPEKYRGLADDKAFMKSIKFKRPDTLTIGQLKRVHSIATHGIDIRNNIDLSIADFYRNKANAIKLFNEPEQVEFDRQIKLLERVRDK